MDRIEYRDVIDKSEWLRGPWDSEPDKIQWQDTETGLPCLIVRGPVGALCGYVGVPPGHPWYGQHYDADSLINIDVHGGLTFAHGCTDTSREAWEAWRNRLLARKDEAEKYPVGDAARALRDWAIGLAGYEAWLKMAQARHICHIAPSEPEPWWLGFDCAHAGDLTPSLSRYLGGINRRFAGRQDEYRDIAYVEDQCRSLTKQIRDAE